MGWPCSADNCRIKISLFTRQESDSIVVFKTKIKTVDSEGLRQYIAASPESRYLLIDVRQPDEYDDGHIPGAYLMPLGELEQKLFTLPPDRDLVFYCYHGPRATVAAMLVEEGEVLTTGQIYLFHGGMRAWDGHAVAALPELKKITEAETTEAFLYQAMNMEKGAGRFYGTWAERLVDTPLETVFKGLQDAEQGHAYILYKLWIKGQKEPQAFEKSYAALKGDIIEGGRSYEAIMVEVADFKEIRLLEWALHLEWSAYDLYRNRAEATQDSDLKGSLFDLVQGEKGHIRQLVKVLETTQL